MKSVREKNASSENTKKKPVIPFSAWLLYLGLITLALSGVTLAKYISTADVIGTLQVAAFNVSADSTVATYDTSVLMEVGPNKAGEFEIEINNTGSDVNVLCDIDLVSKAGLPLVFSAEDENGVNCPVTTNRYINDVEVGYGNSKIITVTVSWDTSELDYRYSYELDYIDVFLDVVQKD